MKRGDKRALSGIVMTLIMILLVLVAIGIVWVVVKNLLESGAGQINLGSITVNMEIKSVKTEANGDVLIKVERKQGVGDIQSLRFIIDDGISSKSFDSEEKIGLNVLEEKTFTIQGYNGIIKSISVVPVLKSDDGEGRLGAISSTKELTRKQTIKNIPGIVSYWGFEGNANDNSGNENNGEWKGTGDAEYVEGRYGKAAKFIGTNYVESTNTVKVPESGAIITWTKGNKEKQESNRLYTVGLKFVCLMGPLRAGLIAGDRGRGKYNLNNWGDQGIYDGEWHHYVVSWNKKTANNYDVNLYIDGNKIGETKTMDSIFETYGVGKDRKILVGGCWNPGDSVYSHKGEIDEVMIFNKALTQEQITALYKLDLS